MKTKKVHRTPRYIALIILGCLIFIFYKIGYIPVIGNIVAAKSLSKYATTLKGSPVKINTSYDWYNSKYVDLKNNFSGLSYELTRHQIHDESLSDWNNLAAKQKYQTIQSSFSSNLQFPSSIDVWTDINAMNYSKKYQKFYLLSIYNTDKLSEEESQRMPATIAQQFINLMGIDYNFTSTQLIYCDSNGCYTIESNGSKKLDYKYLLKKTRKMKPEELSTEYLDWLSLQ